MENKFSFKMWREFLCIDDDIEICLDLLISESVYDN
jgi:hypothetical protein